MLPFIMHMLDLFCLYNEIKIRSFDEPNTFCEACWRPSVTGWSEKVTLVDLLFSRLTFNINLLVLSVRLALFPHMEFACTSQKNSSYATYLCGVIVFKYGDKS